MPEHFDRIIVLTDNGKIDPGWMAALKIGGYPNFHWPFLAKIGFTAKLHNIAINSLGKKMFARSQRKI